MARPGLSESVCPIEGVLYAMDHSSQFGRLFIAQPRRSDRIDLHRERQELRLQALPLGGQVDEASTCIVRISDSSNRPECFEGTHGADRRVVAHSGSRTQFPLAESVFDPELAQEIPLAEPDAVGLDAFQQFLAEPSMGVAEQIAEALPGPEIDGVAATAFGPLSRFFHCIQD